MKKLILIAMAAALTASAWAQDEVPPAGGEQYRTAGYFEGGFWQVLKDPGSAKFQEYRQVKEHLLLNRFGFELTRGNQFFRVNANELGKTDQRATARFGLVRKWKNKVTWSQTPHLLSTDTREFFVNAGGGVFILPDSIQAALSTGSSSAVTAKLKNFLDGAQPFELSAQRNTGGATSEFKPRSDVTVKAGYINERKQGSKQLGVTLGFNPVELPEPLNYETHRLSASAELARKDFSASVGYSGRVFNNKTEVVIRDNLFRVTTDTIGNPLRARLALPVDNMAHNFTFTGAYNLPKKTRSVATVSYGVATQNEPFLPHTINSFITDPSGGLTLPAASLDGKFKTLLVNYYINSRPMDKLSLKGKVRYYEFDNQTPSLDFGSRVAYDASLDTLGRVNLPYGYIKRDYGGEAGYQIVRQANASFAYTRENITRNHREVKSSKEDILKGTLDVRPATWVTLRTSYAHADRRSQEYDTLFFEESFPEGEAVTNPAMSLNELRRFDVYNRDRDNIELSSQLSPIDELDVGLSFSLAQDKFADTDYGLEALWNRGWSVDISYNPVPRLTLFGDIGREDGRAEMESRYRPVVANVGLDSLNNDWSGALRDRFERYGLGFSAEVWPKKVNWGADYGFTYSQSALLSSFAPGGVAAGNAVSFPNVYYKLHRIGSQVTYRLTGQTALKFSYWYEKYLETDWAIDPMQPFMAAANRSVFLGFRIPDYEAHVLALKLSYAF
jgi:MtrB/PioB family decaheme-associated outer membrane protein